MGEAMLTRAGGAGGSSEPAIPVLPGYHSILVTLRDYQGGLVKNYGISCNDGAQTYNYTTNEKGQSLFTTNSGKANFTVSNSSGSIRYIDFNETIVNKDAPLGQVTKLNINLAKATSKIVTASGNYGFLLAINVNAVLCGGGGGGGGGSNDSRDEYDSNAYGGRGGNGYTESISYAVESNKNYYITIGQGGSGGKGSKYTHGYQRADNGSTGGTTTFAGFSATGGGGGEGAIFESITGIRDGRPGSGGPGLSPYGIGGSGGYLETGNGSTGKSGCVKFTF